MRELVGFRSFVIFSVLLASPVVAGTPEDTRRAYDTQRFVDLSGMWNELTHQGDASSYFALGLSFDLGNGLPQDPERAFYWYKKAADLDLANAQFNVAVMYDTGRGTAQDSKASFIWYLLAATQGHHRAQFNLAMLYEQGVGTEKDMAEARRWYRAAACGGIEAAAAKLKNLSVKDKECHSNYSQN